MAEFPAFDRGLSLATEAAIATSGGFHLRRISPRRRRRSTRTLPRSPADSPQWEIGTLRTARSIRYELACNWKLVVQNYSECYHCPLVHPQLDKLSPSDSGRNDLIEGPFLGGYSELRNHGTSLTTTGRHGAAAARQRGRREARPHLLLLDLSLDAAEPAPRLRDGALSRGRSPRIAPQLIARGSSIRGRWTQAGFDPSDAVDFWDLTNRQDWHVSELTQPGVESRAYAPGAVRKCGRVARRPSIVIICAPWVRSTADRCTPAALPLLALARAAQALAPRISSGATSGRQLRADALRPSPGPIATRCSISSAAAGGGVFDTRQRRVDVARRVAGIAAGAIGAVAIAPSNDRTSGSEPASRSRATTRRTETVSGSLATAATHWQNVGLGEHATRSRES